MAGKHLAQRLVLKLSTSRLRRSKWNITMTIKQARANKELIALSESQCMRWIDELNGVESDENRIDYLRKSIDNLKYEENLSISRPKIKKAYKELESLLYKKDYCCVVIDKIKDFDYINKRGFTINGVKFKRLLGTSGGLKKNTVVFINEDLWSELDKRINNGRNLEKKLNPSKFEAYKALVCSSSTPVSMPNGVVVVPDCRTEFKADIIKLDDTVSDEPTMEIIKENECSMDENDGYGMAMPSLMERWGEDMGVHYLLPACVLRNSFCKGAVFPIDFQKFAHEHGFNTITDSYGKTYNIDEVELILTESMLKLWDSYSSIEEYLNNCEKNNYSFCITKCSEQILENERNMNYQFLQSYDFTDEQLDELIKPTVDDINEILSDDYRKTILYTKGINLNERNVVNFKNDFSTALMIEPKLKDDPFVNSQIQTMIRKRIDEAKVGVLKVEGCYSFVSGDPYTLCQNIWGLEKTGLLKAGEVYSKYWSDKGVDKIVAYRAPMTSHNNIRLMDINNSDQARDFYKYMTTPIIFNSWDACCDAMNGMDKD